jgi:hypothetical protein
MILEWRRWVERGLALLSFDTVIPDIQLTAEVGRSRAAYRDLKCNPYT